MVNNPPETLSLNKLFKEKPSMGHSLILSSIKNSDKIY